MRSLYEIGDDAPCKISKTFGVYAIINAVNGRAYIGSTARNFSRRWRCHKSKLNSCRHHNRHLQRSWSKHGEDRFIFRVLEVCATPDCLTNREDYWTEKFRRERGVYNIREVSESNLGHQHSPEAKAKISAATIGRRHSKSALDKLRAHGLQCIESPGMRQKLVESRVQTYEGFISPDGQTHTNIINLSQFCRDHGLNVQNLHKVHLGQIAHHRGWTRLDRSLRKYQIIAPNGTEFSDVISLSGFCKKHGLHRGNMNAVANGHRSHHKQWKVVVYEKSF